MLEVRYNTDTKELTAWCGDSEQFGNLDRGRDNEAIVILDIPIPTKPIQALLFDEATQTLIDNPDYVGPEPSRDPLVEIDKINAKIADYDTLKARVETLEKK